VHINATEFVVVLLQLVAFTVRLETLTPDRRTILLPAGIPIQPILLCFTDNTSAEAWANKVTSKSLQGQPLIGMLAALLRARHIGLNTRLTILPALKTSWPTSSHAPLILPYPMLTAPNRYIRSTPQPGPGIISSRVQSSYRASPPCSPAHQRWTCQIFQRVWDNSFPPDPLSHVRPRYEVGRRLPSRGYP
jgi:hypothetical protein